MKIVCDNCAAKYSISDDKVAGKVFKIRCKRCQSVIVVRGDAPAPQPDVEEEPTRVHDYASDAVWYVVVEGEQRGPMTAIQLVSLFARDTLNLESYVWREGFQDWLPIQQVPELLEMVQGSESEAPGARAVSDQPAARTSDPGFGFDGDGRRGDLDDPTLSTDLGLDGARGDLFGSHDAVSDDIFAGVETSTRSPFDEPASQPKARVAASRPSGPMTGQRNENSVLFSLDNLQQLATHSTGTSAAPSARAVSSRPAGSVQDEASGLFDIRALAQAQAERSASPQPKLAHEDLFISGPATSSALGAPILAPAAQDPDRNNKWMWLGLLGGVVVICGLIAAMWFYKQPDRQLAVSTPGTVTPVASAPSTPAPGKTDQAPAIEAAAPAKNDKEPEQEPAAVEAPAIKADTKSDDTRKGPTPTRPKTTPTKSSSTKTAVADSKPSKKSSGSLDSLMDEVLDGAGPTKKSEPVATESDSGLPDIPSRDEVLKAMNGVSGAVRNCKQGDSGIAMVSVTFSGSTGRASSASVVSGPFKGTPVGSCIANAAKNARVSRFKRSSFNVKFPYSL